jgi:hypothetical protein
MKKLLLAVSALLLGFGTSAQTIAIQGFDASSNTWSYTTTPASYNFPSLNDIWLIPLHWVILLQVTYL